MALTPADVHNQQFTTVRMRTGYDMDEVDAFLDVVETEIGRLLAENDDLRAQVTQAQSRALAAQQRAAEVTEGVAVADPAPVNPGLAEIVAQASADPAVDDVESTTSIESIEVVETAQMVEVAEVEVAEVEVAEVEVAEVGMLPAVAVPADGGDVDRTPPSEQALKILEIAQRTADETVAHAKAEASSILTKARSEAAEVTADLDAQRTALEKQVGQLRTFERNYRIALRDHIAGQLAEFDRSATKEDSVVGPTPAIESVQAALDD